MNAVALAIQFAALVALVIYAWDTRNIRKAAQEQAEAVQKPFLTLVTHERDRDDAILDLDGVVGTRIIGAIEGNVGLRNEGSGPAINIRYNFEPSFPNPPANASRPSSYLPSIPARETSSIPVPREVFRGLDYQITINYQSLSGKTYESKITMTNLVVTTFSFESVESRNH